MVFNKLIETGTKNWKSFGMVIGLLAAVTAVLAVILGAVIVVAFTLIARTFDLRPSQLSLFGGAGILLQATHGSDDRREYLVLVNPQGWERTEIHVEAGDTLHVTAQGRVQISSGGLVRSGEARRAVERRWIEQGRIDLAAGRTPEDWFPDSLSPTERQSIVPERSWLGPSGDQKGSVQDHRYPGRTRRKVMPDMPYGGLLAAVVPLSQDTAYRPIFVGSDTTIVATHAGHLWFTVNDVQHPLNLFFVDNIGGFLVRVAVQRP